MRKLFIILMLIAVLCLQFLVGTAAASDSESRISFKDMSSSHWAYKDVVKLNLRGVIKGYNDSTFRPDKPVTQIEAILMAVNNMEGPTGATIDEASESLPIEVPNWVEENCKKEVLFSLQKGLIVPSENNFNATAPASRAWIAKLLVRMINKEKDALGIKGPVSDIKDASSIPAWANSYVNLAIKYKLLKGYPDKSFKPSQSVTRSEIVSILSRSEQFLPLDKVTRGKLLGVYDQNLFMVSDEKLNIYDLAGKMIIFNEEGKQTDMQSLTEGQEVSVVENGPFIDYLEVLPANFPLKTFGGTAAKTLPEEGVLITRDENLNVFAWTLSDKVSINSQAGEIETLAQIPSGIPLEIGINGQNKIVYIMVLNGSETEAPPSSDKPVNNKPVDTDSISVTGTVVSVNDLNRTISVIDDEDYSLKTYEVHKNAEVYIDNIKMNLEDIMQGMKIQIKLENNRAVYLESTHMVSGIIKSIDKARNKITLKMTSVSRTFTFTDDIEINIEGLSNSDIDDINPQDYAELKIEDDEVTEINVRTMFSFQVVTATKGAGQIVVWDENGFAKELTLERNTTVVIPGLNTPSPEDLLVGDYITATYFGSKIRNVEVVPVTRGKISQINTSRNTLTVESFNGKTETFSFNAKSMIITGSSKNYDLDSLQVGNRLEISQTSENGYSFKVMTKDSGKIQSLTNTTSKITIVKDSSFQLNRYLASDIYIHEGEQTKGISDLGPDIQVEGYSLNGIIYEVEIK